MRVVVPYTQEVLDSVIFEYQNAIFPFQIFFIFLAFFYLWSGMVYLAFYFEKNSFALIAGAFVVALLPFHKLNVVGIVPLATLAFFVVILFSLRSKKLLHVALLLLIYALFWLYWSYLLEDLWAVLAYGICILGIIWVVFVQKRYN